MTLPVNRYTALLETRTFLPALVSDREMTEHVQQRALSLLKHFPGESELRKLAELAPDLLSVKLVS